MTLDDDAPAPPEALESGRYKVFGQENGFIIARATGLCEACAGHDCGEQQEILDLSPGGVAKLMGQAKAAGLLKLPFPFRGRM